MQFISSIIKMIGGALMNDLSRKHCKLVQTMVKQYSLGTLEKTEDILLSKESLKESEQIIDKLLALLNQQMNEQEFLKIIETLDNE